MTTSVPLGVGLPPLETRRDVVLHVATRAEELDYTGFYLAEGWGHDAGVLLAEVAARTDRIQIGTGVLNVWGRSPASIAMLAASLDEVSGGRFALGLGAGSPQLAEGLHDVPFDAPIERLGAVVRQVRRLLAGERMVPAAAAPGRALRLAVRPPAEIPINLAGLGPRSVRLSGELADGWYPFLLPRSALDESARMLAEGAARRGPGRSVPRICPGLPMAVAPDHAAARAVASWWVVFYLTSMGPLYRDTLRRLGFGAAVDDVLAANTDRGSAEVPASADVLLDELTICGDAAAARAGLQRWYAAGADMPVIVLPPNRATDELDYVLEAMRPVDEFRGSLGSDQLRPTLGGNPMRPVVISLPIADRQASYRFYGEGLGLRAVGEPADDGVPEPLQFVLNDGARLMLVPTGGFGWVIGEHEVALPGRSECVIGTGAESPGAVDAMIERARRAGAKIVNQPAKQPWGYTGTFADPDDHLWMVTAEPVS